ncbi:hypothetical protein LTR97_001941 [Elasticomyces elasticus]|uniref:Uncharacterized protein n=1 Tax=Elasticomyces elasticus TaxID=574655 RepID=A0AAN8A4I4_9PEZI|nr:hypothetical protein LTR97_001941 [Elasticomyces elasticus]
MEKIKSMLPGHSHTAVDGGSSYPHSSKASDGKDHTPLPGTSTHAPHGEHSSGGTTGGFAPEEGHGLLGSTKPLHESQQHSAAHDASLARHGENAAEKAAYREEKPYTSEKTHHEHSRHAEHDVAGARHGDSAAERAAYREEKPFTSKGTQRAHGQSEQGLGAAGAALGTAGVAGARHEHGTDRDVASTHGTSSGTSGLETRDPYRAAQQAGALPDKNDISNVDREVAAGGIGNVGATQGGTHRSAGGLTEERTPSHGLNAGINDPVSVRGPAPVSEPIHQDPSLMGVSTGHSDSSQRRHENELPTRGVDDSALSGTSIGLGNSSLGGNNGLSQGGLGASSTGSQGVSGQGVGSEGLIHGHHTTLTGEKLDPHVGSEHSSGLGHSSRSTGTGLQGSSSQGLGRDDYDNSTSSGLGRESTDNYGTSTTHTKPSMMDKLNPKKDADGDGKAGFMK